MSYKDDRAVEAAVLRCERALQLNPALRGTEQYRLYYQQTMDDIGRIRHRPGLVTQLRRRMTKVKPVAPAAGPAKAAEVAMEGKR